jgi:hypothetical protein
MGGPHQRFDQAKLAGVFLESEQSFVEGLGMALDLGPEKLEHGRIAEVLGVA